MHLRDDRPLQSIRYILDNAIRWIGFRVNAAIDSTKTCIMDCYARDDRDAVKDLIMDYLYARVPHEQHMVLQNKMR